MIHLFPELGGGELALSYQALHRLGVDVQDLGGFYDVDVVLKHGIELV